LGSGDGTFIVAASTETGIYPDSVAVGDFNGDGKADLAVTNSYSQTVTILLGNGNGTFTTAPTLTAGSNADSVAVTDFNLDGIEDLAVSSSNSDAVTLYLGKGDGTFTQAFTAYGSAPYSVSVGDFASTGIPDLAAAESGNGEVLVLLNQAGTTALASLTGIAVPGGGKHNVTYSYPGNGEYDAGSANPVLLTGTPIATKTALTITPVTAIVGQTVQFCATVNPASVGGLKPTGTVTYYAGTVALGTVAPGAIFNTTFSTAGVRTITDEV
jgi:VCBS repeat protein